MPPERTAKSRQDPVSCHMCRAKKLKCDRDQPCSNCTSRGWTCEYSVRQDPVACRNCRGKKLKCGREQPCANCSVRGIACVYSLASSVASHRPAPSDRALSDELEAENRTLRSRVDRLEQAVFGSISRPPTSIGGENMTTVTSQATEDDDHGRVQRNVTSRQFEKVVVSLNHAVPQFMEEISITYQDVSDLVRSATLASSDLQIILPSRDTAYRLLDFYEDNLDTVQHVMHVPSFRKKLRAFYENFPQPDINSQTGMIALFLAICAQVGVYDAYGGGIFPSQQAGMSAAIFLAKQGLKMIDHSRSSSKENYLELVQACILLEFFCYHIEGYSLRARLLHSTSVTLAHEIDLHKTDAQTAASKSRAPPTRLEIIDCEVRRKLWWHLTSTDWLIAFIGGPAEGIYSIQPRYIQVRKPRNINNDDLETRDADFSRPDQEQTIMSYYNQRVKLAYICRGAVDVMYGRETADVPYDEIIALESQFSRLFADLPRFLRLDITSDTIQRELGGRYSTRFALQRATTNLMAYSRRCKLHLPFLMLYKSHERYAASRRHCLESARKIFEVRRIFTEDTSSLLTAFVKVLGIYHHVFYATLVLVMDLCINDPHDKAQLHETRAAVKMVEDVKDDNPLAKQFLASLGEVLRRYRVKIPTESAPDYTTTSRADEARVSSGDPQTMQIPNRTVHTHVIDADHNALPQKISAVTGDEEQVRRSAILNRYNLPGFRNDLTQQQTTQQHKDAILFHPSAVATGQHDVTMPDVASIPLDFGVPEFEDFWQSCLGHDGDMMSLDPQDWDALRSDLETRII